MNTIPKISLVGAGPGDPELITLKGMKALQNAKVVLYDALANAELLALAPEDALTINVGKRAGRHRFSQNEINRMLVEHALNYGSVVRLKGGDPFVFGRGYEEIEYAKIFNIETEVIPGISSCIAVAESQNIPLTKRKLSHSFWVLTATTSEGELSKDIALAVQSSATVVILMGLKKLPEIVRIYAENEKADTPIMIVQNGTLPNEKCVVSNMRSIERAIKKEGLGTPAIMVIGEVVRCHDQLERKELLSQILPQTLSL